MIKYQILLYYKYVDIKNPEKVMKQQRALCAKLNLKGRIIIAKEGINGTVEGTTEATKKYIAAMKKIAAFKNIPFKKSPGTGNAFPKLSVKIRSEIVTGNLGAVDVNPQKITGTYLPAEKLHEWFRRKKDFVVVDMRNDYEHAVGKFKGSVLPPLKNFRDLPGALPKLAKYKNKTVVTVCTGGVRCEKASGFLVQNGFKKVYQLKDGIHTYMEKFPAQDFLGSLYVFDGRIAVSFDTKDATHTIIGRCRACKKPSERYINCANLSCHDHFILCSGCAAANGGNFCSSKCSSLVLKK